MSTLRGIIGPSLKIYVLLPIDNLPRFLALFLVVFTLWKDARARTELFAAVLENVVIKHPKKI
jgi:hypothetical protein